MRGNQPIKRHILSVLLYILALYSLRPASFKALLPPWQWDSFWIFSFAVCLWLAGGIFSDWCIINGHTKVWQRLQGPADDETIEKIKRFILQEGQQVAWEKGFASKCLLLSIMAAWAAFVYFTFFAL